MMNKINEFVHDSNSEDKLIFQIYSYPLKKALSKKVNEKYMNTGVFTEFQRQSPETIIKKSKNFKQVHYLKEF